MNQPSQGGQDAVRAAAHFRQAKKQAMRAIAAMAKTEAFTDSPAGLQTAMRLIGDLDTLTAMCTPAGSPDLALSRKPKKRSRPAAGRGASHSTVHPTRTDDGGSTLDSAGI